MKARTLFATGLSVFLGIFSNCYSVEHTQDSLDTVKQQLADKTAVLLDVREKDEWDKGHLKDAIHLPLSSIKQGITADELAKVAGEDSVIYLHCAAGRRSLEAAKQLTNSGRDLRPLKPGYQDLLNAGFPKAGP